MTRLFPKIKIGFEATTPFEANVLRVVLNCYIPRNDESGEGRDYMLLLADGLKRERMN